MKNFNASFFGLVTESRVSGFGCCQTSFYFSPFCVEKMSLGGLVYFAKFKRSHVMRNEFLQSLAAHFSVVPFK
jgi:hypothetical protein